MKTIFALLLSVLFSVNAEAQTTHTVPIKGGGTGQTTSGMVLSADTAITAQALTKTPLAFTLGANTRYEVAGTAILTSSAASGLQLGWRIPSGDTLYITHIGTDTTVGIGQTAWSAVTADSGLTSAFVTLNGTGYVRFEGYVSGPTSGPVALGALKLTSGTATVKKGSTLVWKRLY